MRRLAFFDIDGTIFRSSLLIEIVRAFVREGVFPQDAERGYEQEYIAWTNRTGTYEAYIDAVVRTFVSNIHGVHYGMLADIGRAVVEEHEKHVYRYTSDLLTTLKREGYYVVAISQSPKTILDEFCARYGFDKVYGRLYELGPTDRFTGAIAEEHIIANKANIARRVSEQENIPLTTAVGVGDTEGDIPLLEIVGTPICFNPNKRLYDHARRMGWKVVVERKDMIYEM